MVLHQHQKIIAKDRHRFKVIRAGRRFGKTVLAGEIIKARALSKPSKIAYIAPTYQQARDIAWEMLKKELQPIILNVNESRLELTVRTQNNEESLIILRGWESIETLRGQAFDLLVIDEVAMMRNFWVNWHEVLRPTLTDRKGEVIFISTPKGYNHFYDLNNLELTDKDFKSFHFTSYDNPYLPVDELDKAKATLPQDRFEQEYMASFQKTEGLVYKEFSRVKHLYVELPEGNYQKIGGVDFGYTHPAAVLDIRLAKDKLWVEDEWCKRGRTDAVIADYVQACKFEEVYPDPENAGGIEELRQRNINVREVLKGKGSVIAGIQKVREYLLTGKLMINSRCVNLISEFEMYSYDDNQDGKDLKENPIKEFDDALDALRYVVLMIQPQVSEADKVRIEQNRYQRNQSSDVGL